MAECKTNGRERYDVTPERASYRYASQSGVRGRLDRALVLAVFRFEVTRLTNASTSAASISTRFLPNARISEVTPPSPAHEPFSKRNVWTSLQILGMG